MNLGDASPQIPEEFFVFLSAQIISKVDPEPIVKNRVIYIPPKTKMDTQNDGLERVNLLKSGHFWYQFVRFLGWFHPYKWYYKWVSGVMISPRNQWSIWAPTYNDRLGARLSGFYPKVRIAKHGPCKNMFVIATIHKNTARFCRTKHHGT